MRRFWTAVIEPLLRGVKPRTIVEIGSDRAENTRHLVDFCQHHDAVLHAIDPKPGFDVAAWQREQAGCFVFHQQLSLEALPLIGAMDAVLIDGDHNWYTVFHELRAIETLSAQLGHPFPLVFLHDTGWPYGRRDLYYDPPKIPDRYRQAYRRAGMRMNVSELQENGGLNPHLNHAVFEGGAQNGVLTAIEDFLAATSLCLKFSQAPGFHRLGILASCERIADNTALAGFVLKIDDRLAQAERVRALEAARLWLEIEVEELERKTQANGTRPSLARLRWLAAKLRRKLINRQLSQSIAELFD